MTNLTTLAQEIHQGNVRRGFYDVPLPLGTKLMLVVSELGEALEAERNGRRADLKGYEEFTPYQFNEQIKDSVEDEIADAVIRLLDLSASMDIDIHFHVMEKLKYNATRERLHGKAF